MGKNHGNKAEDRKRFWRLSQKTRDKKKGERKGPAKEKKKKRMKRDLGVKMDTKGGLGLYPQDPSLPGIDVGSEGGGKGWGSKSKRGKEICVGGNRKKVPTILLRRPLFLVWNNAPFG